MSGDVRVRVLIAEPKELHAAVLMKALEGREFAVDAYAGTVAGLLEAAAGRQVLVLGPTAPRIGMADVVPKLIIAGTRLLVISQTAFDDADSQMLFAGATGFLSMSDSGLADVAEAVLAISRGSTALNPEVVHEVLLQWRRQRSAPAGSDVPVLTVREREVLEGLRDGLTTRLLAKRLGVAEKTVEAHRSKLFTKLAVRNQAQAVRSAHERGLL